MDESTKTLNFINGYATEAEADAARLRLKDPDKYIVFSIHREDQRLFCWIPRIAGELIFENKVDI